MNATTENGPVLKVRIEEQLALVEMHRPHQLNALNMELMRQLREQLAELARNRQVRAVALIGAGRIFCAGADVKTFGPLADDAAGLREYFNTFAATVEELASLPLPTVAGIQGGCHGGGISLALACDLRISDPTSLFSLPPARLGLHYGEQDMRRLVRAVGHAVATDLLIAARRLSAEEAHHHRLVQYLCGEGEVVDSVLELGHRLSQLSLSSIGSSKRFLSELTGVVAKRKHPHFTNSPEIAEGVRAFRDRQPAAFSWHPVDVQD